MKSSPERLERVLALRNQGMTLAQIALSEGISRQRVWQLSHKLDSFERRLHKTIKYTKCLNMFCEKIIMIHARRKFCSRKCVHEYYKALVPDEVRLAKAEAYRLKKQLYAKQRYHNVIKLRRHEKNRTHTSIISSNTEVSE